MAGRGPQPAESRTRARDTKETIKLVSDGKKRGPALPILMIKGKRTAWHSQTRKWWENWRTSPQALRMMTGPDWDFLLDTALMHHHMWTSGSFEQAAEVRLRVQKFGATPEDRSRLRVEIGTGLPNATAPTTQRAAGMATVSNMDDERHARVLGQG
jgi:hypothetical protein